MMDDEQRMYAKLRWYVETAGKGKVKDPVTGEKISQESKGKMTREIFASLNDEDLLVVFRHEVPEESLKEISRRSGHPLNDCRNAILGFIAWCKYCAAGGGVRILKE